MWLTGGLWLIAVGHYHWGLPPPVLGGVAIMVLIAALMEWLTGGEPPR
jgi:hypothetical protein